MAKKSQNDELIDKLLKIVEEKKKLIEKIKNPVFKSNLSFPMEAFGSSNRINLNVASDEVLFSLLAYLDNLIDVAVPGNHGVEYPRKWYGYTLEDWRDDIVLVIKKKQSQTQVSELKAIESKLNSLISEEKKKDIELQNLSKLLES